MRAPPKPGTLKLAQTVIIGCPRELVFAFRCALANSPSWQRGVVSATLAEPGPTQLGTRCREVRHGPQGTFEEWELEVTEYEPGCVLGISGTRADACWVERHSFTNEGNITRYVLALEVTGSALPAATIQKQMVETALQLKWALETPSPRTF